jgi:hypothetical protein
MDLPPTFIEAMPAPLRGLDSGSFAEYTIRTRLKEIASRTLEEGDFPASVRSSLHALIADLPDGVIRPLHDSSAPDALDWSAYTAPFLGQSWLQVPWFFAETYFYRRLLEATGYFMPGALYRVDPYAHQKRQGLEQFQPAILQSCCFVQDWLAKLEHIHLADRPTELRRALGEMLLHTLWGNQADLSMWPVGESARPDHAESDQRLAHLLVDERMAAIEHLCAPHLPASRIDIILDNTGLELVNDLLFADFVLHIGLTAQVTLHAKAHPTFVSDALIADIHQTILFLHSFPHPAVQSVAASLQARLASGALLLKENFYWNSPLPFWEAPRPVVDALQGSRLVISKGDANYRRFLGDRHWLYEAPARLGLGYLPFAYLALRVSKSDMIIGLQPGQTERLNALDSQWMVNGRWGMLQFVLNS